MRFHVWLRVAIDAEDEDAACEEAEYVAAQVRGFEEVETNQDVTVEDVLVATP